MLTCTLHLRLAKELLKAFLRGTINMLQTRNGLRAALAVLACLYATGVQAQGVQNIDTTQPILRTYPLTGTDDYFGYQVVLHQTAANVDDRNAALDNARIIVSAPRGTHPSSSVQNTGLIFECPVTPGSCDGLTGDSGGADNRLYDAEGNANDENKSGQFLGISLDSSGDRFVACAHRYVSIDEDNYNPIGRCFHSDRDLQGFRDYQPCSGVGERATFSVGVCQAGTSAAIAETSDGETAIGLGAPGVYTWRGIVIRQNPNLVTSYQAFGEATQLFALQGYSMTKGNILTLSREDFVVSVPRRNFYFGTVNIVTNTNQLSVVSQPLQGTQIGEYYGFALAAVDLTGDGFDELLVGAPLYSDDAIGAETGRVYVYRNVGGSLQLVRQLVGVQAYSRFGHAITSIGDINDDGLEDVAISAPFGEGSGKVYIYHGSSNQLITPQPQQTIAGEDVAGAVNPPFGNLVGFGASLASGLDVDLNTYDDLAIGSYESQAVFLLRTRPVATLSTTLSATPNPVEVDLQSCSLGGSNFACFTIQICTTLSGRGLNSNLPVTFTLTGDSNNVNRGLQSRVFFDDAVTQPATSNLPRTVQMAAGSPDCFTVTAYIKEDIADIFNAFTIDLEVQTTDLPDDPSWDGNQTPIDLSSYPIAFISGTSQLQVETLKECDGGVCVPDLQLTVGDVLYRTDLSSSTPVKLTAGFVSELTIPLVINNAGNDAYAAQLGFVLPNGILDFVRVDPPNAFVTCTPETLMDMQMTLLTCNIGNPFRENESKELFLVLSTGSSLVGDEGVVSLSFNVSSINDVGVPAAATIELEVDAQADLFLDNPGLVSPQQVSYALGSPEIGQLVNVSQLGPRFTVSFVVRNTGPSTIPAAEITIDWPLRAGNPDVYLLYPFSISASSTGSVSCDTTYINQLGLTTEGGGGTVGTGGRKKRSKRRAASRKVTKRQAGTSETVSGGAEERTISCASPSGGLECVPITCEIMQLARGASTELQLTAYLDERYFTDTVDRFTVVPIAGVSIKNADYIVQPQNTGTSEVARAEVRVIPVTRSATRTEESIEWWVIALPIILGVLFIVVVGGILWGVGFFRRKKHEEIKQKREELQALNGPE